MQKQRQGKYAWKLQQRNFSVTFSATLLHNHVNSSEEEGGVRGISQTYILDSLGNPEAKDDPEETARLSKRMDRGRVGGKQGLDKTLEGRELCWF